MTIVLPGATGAHIDVGDDPSLRLTGACTYMAQIRMDADIQNIDFISKQTSSDRGISLQTDDADPDTFGIFVIAETSSVTMSSGWTASPLVTGEWNHLGGQFDPSNSVGVRLNGVLSNEKTVDVPATMYNPANNLFFGCRPDGGTSLEGAMDDIRIYNRTLTDEEWAACARGIMIWEGLISWWSTREGAPGVSVSGADSVKDLGLLGNHGTPSGSNVYGESFVSARR